MDDGDCVRKQVSRYKWRLHLWGACVIGDASTITHCCVCFHSCKYLGPSVASLVFNCNETSSKSNESFFYSSFWLIILMSSSAESVLRRKEKREFAIWYRDPSASAPSPPLPQQPQILLFPLEEKKTKGGKHYKTSIFVDTPIGNKLKLPPRM